VIGLLKYILLDILKKMQMASIHRLSKRSSASLVISTRCLGIGPILDDLGTATDCWPAIV